MSLMQLPAPNTSAKVTVIILEALLLCELCSYALISRMAAPRANFSILNPWGRASVRVKHI